MDRKEGYLRLIIMYKTTMGIMEVLISFSLLTLINRDIASMGLKVAHVFNLDIDNHYIGTAIARLGMIGNNHIIGLSIGAFIIGMLNLIESYGLHLRMRWAEWLTVVATSVFIPFELYEVYVKVTILRVSVLFVNCAIVYYLVKHRELFRSRREVRIERN